MREGRDCGVKMWMWERAVTKVGEEWGRASWSWDWICRTRREMLKVPSVSRMATQAFWPPFDVGRMAVAVRW